MRTLISRVHKWLGLFLALWVVLVALTGTLLLFKTQLLQFTYPALDLPEVPSNVAAAKVFDDFSAGYAYLPTQSKPWIEVHAGDGTAHYFDATGQLLVSRAHLGDWISWMVEFHHHLLLDDLGKDLMGYFGLLSLLLVVTGLIRWWPRHWSWRALTVRWFGVTHKNFAVTLWQAHRSIGVLAFVPLLLLLVTGTLIMYSAWTTATLSSLLPQQAESSVKVTTNTQVATDWQSRLAVAKSIRPDLQPRLVYLAPTEQQHYRMRLKYPHEWHPNGRNYISFNADGQIAEIVDVQHKSLGYRVAQTVYPLHVAAVGGNTVLLLLTLGGLALIFLPISGVWFWLWRQRKKS